MRTLHGRQRPVAVVGTSAELPEVEGPTVLPLAPLSEGEMRRLAHAAVYVDSPTAARLAAAAAGAPGHLVASIRDLVDHLEPGVHGHRLPVGVEVPVRGRPGPVGSPSGGELASSLRAALARGDDAAAVAHGRAWLWQTRHDEPARRGQPAFADVLEALTVDDDLGTLRALGEVSHPPTDLTVHLALAKAQQTTAPSDAIASARAAEAYVSGPSERAQQQLLLATLLFYRQQDDEAFAVADALDPSVLAPSARAEWLRFQGQRAMIEGDAAAAERRLAEAQAFAASEGLADRVTVTIIATRAVVAYLRDDLPRAEALYLQAIEAFGGPEAAGAAQTMMNLGYLWLKTDREAEARALFDVLVPVARRAGMPRPLGYALLAQWAIAERDERAAACFAEGFPLVQELGLWSADFALLVARVRAGRNPARQGDAERLDRHLSEVSSGS